MKAAAARSELVSPPAPRIRGIGVVTGWGDDVRALSGPVEQRGERGGGLVTAPTPALDGDRFRRATRECLLAVAVAKAVRPSRGQVRGRRVQSPLAENVGQSDRIPDAAQHLG